MFKKFHVATREAKPRFTQPVRSGIIDWSSGCIGCLTCVKKACPQAAYDQRLVDPVTLQDNMDSICADCYRCVQSCPQRLIQKTLNPEFESLGDEYWTPNIIGTTWTQAATGKIPVSGAGYGGPFSGPGFDAMWTDMSEIVRPTRDGIHGREYISTTIQIGRRHLHLSFDADGSLASPVLPSRELSLPMAFRLPDGLDFGPRVSLGLARAAAELETFIMLPAEDADALTAKHPALSATLTPVSGSLPAEPGDMVMLSGAGCEPEAAAAALAAAPEQVIGFSLEMDADTADRAVDLVRAGAGLLHLSADDKGRTKDGRFIKDAMRDIHLALVERTLRDQVTIMVSGGLAMAEHLAKIIICGADGVILDWPLLLALECRRCQTCVPEACPLEITEVSPAWAAQRIMNLMGAWRDQLIEVMGAMGMREIRRLRGEVGRAMFFEELEAEVFKPIFSRSAEKEVLQ